MCLRCCVQVDDKTITTGEKNVEFIPEKLNEDKFSHTKQQ